MKLSLSQIEALVRSGEGVEARAALRALMEKPVPRPLMAKSAALLRRADLPLAAIRLLNPIVHPAGRRVSTASDEEKAEYAAALSFIGAPKEALALLKTVDDKIVPERLLYEAYALISQWDYQGAIPRLAAYVQGRNLGSYQRIVGQVNLAAALVFERRQPQATYLLREIAAETSVRKLRRLHGITLELSAQDSLTRKDWAGTERLLTQAKQFLHGSQAIEAFFVRKWEAILELCRSHGSASSLAALGAVRREALEWRNWECLRSCDLYEAIVTGNDKLFHRVYFGTPFDSFRKWMRFEVADSAEPPQELVWHPGPAEPSPVTIDLLTGEIEGESSGRLKRGQLNHRLLVALARDFYRPLRLASLHALLYPNEYFNPVTSPIRIHQAMHGLRHWLETSGVPLTLEESSGAYRLVGGAGLKVPMANGAEDKLTVPLGALRRQFAGKAFSMREVIECLKLPRRSVLRILQGAHGAGELVRTGAGAQTRYLFSRVG